MDAEDSIEHYALCPAFHSLCFKHLAISRPSHQQALEDFLCINTCCSILPGRILLEDGDCYKLAVSMRAISLYALGRTITSVRHSVTEGSYLRRCRAFSISLFLAQKRWSTQRPRKTIALEARSRRSVASASPVLVGAYRWWGAGRRFTTTRNSGSPLLASIGRPHEQHL